ncbi:MAG: fused MFS/spermidine synthase [Anaerolineaceae bacterium]|nr:fused MFS/spermidine synthase [Anaerolineaceae bacterium]
MRKFLYVTVFFSGLASLAVEFAASRLLENYFGSSNLVWASIIGLILIYLTAGYFIGGAWADRSPRYSTLFRILAWGALAVGLIPVISRPILILAANAFDALQLGVLLGSFTAVMILLILPITLIGTASPFAIRLAITDPAQAGKISGRIYAISTLGSFIGTFLPVLVLIPLIGTYRTFLVISALLLTVALIGISLADGVKKLLVYLWMPLVLIVLFLLGANGLEKKTPGQVYETESAYNYIQVIQQEGYILLRLNEGQGIHSIYKPGVYNYYGTWEEVLAAPFFNSAPIRLDSVTDVAIVGLAAGTTAKELSAAFPEVQIDGIEIDPRIIAVGRQYFAMNEPNLNVIIQDGRWALAHSPKKYDIISIDAYRPPYIPASLVSQEFFQIVYDHLKPGGVMVINIGRTPEDRRLINSLYATAATIFPTLYVSDLPESYNSMLFATKATTDIQNFRDNYAQLYSQSDTPPFLLEIMSQTYDGLHAQTEPGIVFTDDLAPIEQMTNSLVLNYLLSGKVDTLQ